MLAKWWGLVLLSNLLYIFVIRHMLLSCCRQNVMTPPGDCRRFLWGKSQRWNFKRLIHTGDGCQWTFAEAEMFLKVNTSTVPTAYTQSIYPSHFELRHHAASSGLVASPNPIAAIPFARASGKDYFRTTIFFPANFVTLLAVIWLDGKHYFSAGTYTSNNIKL